MYSCNNQDAFIERPPAAYYIMGKRKIPVDANGVLSWHLMNWGRDMEPHHQIGIFAEAFNDWERYLFPWQFKATRDPSKADIKIYFAEKNEIQVYGKPKVRSPYDFKNAKDTLAVQYEYYPGFEWSMCMIVNDDHAFTNHDEGYNMYKVVRHEIGHALRLGHSSVKGSTMWPEYDPFNDHIMEDDINGLYAAHREHLLEYVDVLDNAKRFTALIAEKASKPKKKLWPWW